MGNVPVTLTMLTIFVLYRMIEGGGNTVETTQICRPFCRLSQETRESCSALRFVFTCINTVWMRCASDGHFHCACEWSHALDNVNMATEELAYVRESTILERCTLALKQDCELWMSRRKQIPCERITKKPSLSDPTNPEFKLKVLEIRESIMQIQDGPKRRHLLQNLHSLIQRRAWRHARKNHNFSGISTSRPQEIITTNGSSINPTPRGDGQHPKTELVSNYTVIDWADTIDGWHKKVLFEHWEKVSEADILETLRRRRMFLLIFGILLGCTIFIIVMSFVIKYQSDRNVRKDINFDGDLDVMGKRQNSFSFMDKLRKERKQKEKENTDLYRMSSLVLYPRKTETNTKTEYRRKPQTFKSPSEEHTENIPNAQSVAVELKESSSSLDLGDRLFPSAMMRSFGTEINSPSHLANLVTTETKKSTTSTLTSVNSSSGSSTSTSTTSSSGSSTLTSASSSSGPTTSKSGLSTPASDLSVPALTANTT
ncbi:uncharacterized protein LOC125667524 [Ostrea edulis]|uniref:uncharacterized protein LOC125667524 n=1 Tax=Ostrea edulis TaxID=37623 RepID=UPI0024AF8C18|nr:uncharacterized protein LOC125667524 [Ostrea edulis]